MPRWGLFLINGLSDGFSRNECFVKHRTLVDGLPLPTSSFRLLELDHHPVESSIRVASKSTSLWVCMFVFPALEVISVTTLVSPLRWIVGLSTVVTAIVCSWIDGLYGPLPSGVGPRFGFRCPGILGSDPRFQPGTYPWFFLWEFQDRRGGFRRETVGGIDGHESTERSIAHLPFLSLVRALRSTREAHVLDRKVRGLLNQEARRGGRRRRRSTRGSYDVGEEGPDRRWCWKPR